MGTTPTGTAPKAQTAQVSATIPKALADWLKETAETRMIGQGLLVAKGLELLKDHLEPDPLTVTPPQPPAGGGPTQPSS